MTFMEKNTILNALDEYAKAEQRREKAARKKGELKKAVEHSINAIMADTLKIEWAKILHEAAGSCKI